MVLACASMLFSTNSAIDLSGLLCESAMIRIAFQSSPTRSLPLSLLFTFILDQPRVSMGRVGFAYPQGSPVTRRSIRQPDHRWTHRKSSEAALVREAKMWSWQQSLQKLPVKPRRTETHANPRMQQRSNASEFLSQDTRPAIAPRRPPPPGRYRSARFESHTW